MKKLFLALFVSIMLIGLVFALPSPPPNPDGRIGVCVVGVDSGCNGGMVGNDTDSHGCKGSAGYTWCETSQKCLRTWEESCVVKIPTPEDEQNRTNTTWNQIKRIDRDVQPNNNRITLQNGTYASIKIMPEKASQTAIDKLKIHNCNESDNCSIQLKEVGEVNKTRAVYEVKVKKHIKIFGLFKRDIDVSSEIDATTGDVVATHRPWYDYLSTSD